MLSRRGFCVLLPGASTYLAHALKTKGDDGAVSQSIPTDDSWSFTAPPESARPYVLWMWMGSNVSATGITADLEAMKEAGIGAARTCCSAENSSHRRPRTAQASRRSRQRKVAERRNFVPYAATLIMPSSSS